MIEKTEPGLKVTKKRGCGEVDTDSDSDEVPDCDDESNTPKTLRRLRQANEAVEK